MSPNLIFRKVDLLIVAILGEIVGAFAFIIINTQSASLPISGAPLLAVFFVGVPIGAAVALYATYILAKKVKPVFFQFGKFAAVGASNTAIDWGVLNLMLLPFSTVTGINTTSTGVYSMLKGFSFLAATFNSFIWNRFWSFEEHGTAKLGKEALQFYAVTIVGLLINVGIATGIKAIGPDTTLVAGVAAPGIATVFSLAWNFVGYKFFVFKKGSPAPPASSV